MAENKKVKVRVLDAVVNVDGKDHVKDDVVLVDEASAKHLESIRYVAYVGKKPESKEDGGGDDDK